MKRALPHLKLDVSFLLLVSTVLLAAFALLRGLLLWRNDTLMEVIPLPDLAMSFVIGLRFDLIIVCYIILPLALFLFGHRGLGQRLLARWWLGITSAAVVFLGVVELDFYREFQTRLNSLVFQYIKEDPETVSKMIWNGFPVLRYLLLVLGLWLLLQLAFRTVHRLTAHGDRPTVKELKPWIGRALGSLALLLLVVGGARGSFSSGPPLRWGDAIHSEHSFANHLALNGTFTLIKAAAAAGHSSQSKWWQKTIAADQALAVTRDMVVADTDVLDLPDQQPVQRLHTPSHGYPAGKIDNIVLIIMESFAGAYVGALGDDHQVTPEFDQLAQQGVLFNRFFANGSHTHQGMFASVACFPNLPGHEYLMQQPEGLHEFTGLPTLFQTAKDNNVYVYNGDFRWDNQAGFFRNQGMKHFIGRDQIDHPKHVDAVWGVSDEDVFHQSVNELGEMAEKGPFYAIIQTLSNHTPFSLPEPLPVEKVTGAGPNTEHLTAMRYSDWALGEFFRTIRDKPYYDKTLFVIVGDHGFSTEDILSEVNLNRFRVPMLMIGPGLRQHFGPERQTIASQVDIVPTAMSLLGKPVQHSCWGRDLLSLPASDPGFAVIKPSGSDQTVAMIEGEDILTLSPETPPVKGVISFGKKLGWRADNNPERAAAMGIQLKGYIRTALDALYQSKTGLEE